MKNFKLFDYQEDMKERIEKALRLHRSVMAQMPTGTGKTVLLASVVESFLREHPSKTVWIVAHRRELVSQIKDTLNKFLLNFNFSNHPVPLSKEGIFSNHPVPLSKEGSTSHPSPLSSEERDVTAPPRRSEPLRSKVGGASEPSPECLSAGASMVSPECLSAGASEPSPGCAGWDRLAGGLDDCLGISSASDNLIEKPLDSSLFTLRSSLIKAVSIQWLSRHYDEIEEEPGMIVIDEAHHVLAKTYKEMWERFPKAKFLGLTATPCRLNGKGFMDLFEVLVQSWDIPEFISKGRLATYDFVSIKPDGVTQRLIDSLLKRGADGDYQNKEMDMLLNKRPSIERLYQSFEEYGKDRKGIVYAINISHANAIVEFYREHGIAAVAIDSKTPSSLRKELIERFKSSSFSKTHPSSLTLKGGSTAFPKFLFSQGIFSNYPVPLSNEGIFSNHPVPLSKEGSTSHPSPLSSEERDVTAPPRRSEPLRSKVGGASEPSPECLSAGASMVSPECLSAGASMVSPECLSAGASMVSPECLLAEASEPSPGCAGWDRLGDGLGDGFAPIQVLVNVDIFSEGFDCPDVEFVQLARPTLSLAKYLQMVGRGLRVAKGKKNCVIIDNVGLYREFVDCNDDFAIVKLPDGKMTVVNRHGEQVIEPGNYYDMKFLRGNILSYRPRRKTVCYYDLLARVLIDEDIHAKDAPEVITINEWEFVVYNGLYRSRTYEDFVLPYRPLQNDLLNRGYYLIYHNDFSVGSGCQVWYYYEGGDGLMRKDYTESKDVCFLRNDYEHVYWRCANLCGDGIVVMDSKQDYYLVDSNLKKTYIGCNNPKNEKEDLNVVMPRLGKKFYHEMMLQKKEMEANEMLLLQKKSEAGHVELYQAGKKWGVKVDGKVIVPPLYHSIAQPVGAYCAFEQIPNHWGVMTLKGKVIVDAKYEKVEIRDNGIAVVTNITGKTQTIHLK